jgi:CheY-like chemotaxis protein
MSNRENMNDPIFKESGVLLVDDEPSFLEMLEVICLNAGFKHVFKAFDGIEALSVLQRNSNEIDLLCIDFAMPNMNGLKLAETVTNQHTRIVGLIMVTGLGTKEIKERFLSLSSEKTVAESFVEKPFDNQIFIRILANALRDILTKRNRQLDIVTLSTLIDINKTLTSQSGQIKKIQTNVGLIESKITTISDSINELSKNSFRKNSSDITYVLVLAALFIFVSGGLIWASFYLPILSILALASVTLLALVLIAVFDLSKGNQLSEKSLMEVLRRSLKILGSRFRM